MLLAHSSLIVLLFASLLGAATPESSADTAATDRAEET